VENHGQVGRTCDVLKRVIDTVPSLDMTLQTSGIQRMTDDYLSMVRYFAPRIMHIHLNDSHPGGEGEQPQAVALGEGQLVIAAILKIMQDAGYAGYCNVEYGGGHGDPTPLIDKSREYLRKVLS